MDEVAAPGRVSSMVSVNPSDDDLVDRAPLETTGGTGETVSRRRLCSGCRPESTPDGAAPRLSRGCDGYVGFRKICKTDPLNPMRFFTPEETAAWCEAGKVSLSSHAQPEWPSIERHHVGLDI